MTRKELAKAVGVSPNSTVYYEQGKTPNPKWDIVVALVRILGTRLVE